jgi:NADH-quinone oxidoreductase subunit L
MTDFLKLFILIPVAGFIISLFIPSKKENIISWQAFTTIGIHLFGATVFIAYWIFHGHHALNLKDLEVFRTEDYDFFLDFYFDKITAVYLFVGSLLTFMVTLYSRYYLHREAGYKRYFNTVLFFYIGYNVIIFSGNMETMFIGWEILGISSFLLIAFYRDRYLPVKNAVKVFSVYRVADVGLILAMWMSHHLWHENITFLKLSNYQMVHAELQTHTLVGVFISVMLLLSAAAKSAQLPFSSWLPRAMEGPTPSTAIFYGALSVHIGVFLLLRTYPLWEHQFSVRILIAVLGLATSIMASGIARVQSSVKSQIAYASIAQIGFIFIEIACGFKNLALWHFAGNAFLRTYQLLVSPSVVTYLIREQFYNFIPRVHTFESSLPKKIQYSFYVLSLKEFNLDSMMYRYLWNPLKWAGKKLEFVTITRVIVFFGIVYLIGLYCVYHRELISPAAQEYLPEIFSFIGLAMVLKSFVERKNVMLCWILVTMSHFWIVLAVSFNETFDFDEVHLYLTGVVASAIIGYMCLLRLKRLEGNIDLDRFHGYSFNHAALAMAFLLSCLGLTGFPITPLFIGEDLIFTHIHEDQPILAAFVGLSLIIDGIAIIRIYARVFLGPHVKSVYSVAYRSS